MQRKSDEFEVGNMLSLLTGTPPKSRWLGLPAIGEIECGFRHQSIPEVQNEFASLHRR